MRNRSVQKNNEFAWKPLAPRNVNGAISSYSDEWDGRRIRDITSPKRGFQRCRGFPANSRLEKSRGSLRRESFGTPQLWTGWQSFPNRTPSIALRSASMPALRHLAIVQSSHEVHARLGCGRLIAGYQSRAGLQL